MTPDRRAAIREHLHADEPQLVRELAEQLAWSDAQRHRAVEQAKRIVTHARRNPSERSILDVFLREFGLSTNEGVALLSLAEALLRIPDPRTCDNFIADKIHSGQWARYTRTSPSWLVRSAAAALGVSKNLVALEPGLHAGAGPAPAAALGYPGKAVVRSTMRRAIRLMGSTFVVGQTIEEALKRARAPTVSSFDMLGEGARTSRDAQRHFNEYRHAIRAVGAGNAGNVHESHGVSVKLSALHPRYELAQRDRLFRDLLPAIKALALQASTANIHLTIDAEEAARLDLSLDVIESLARDADLAGWQGLGLALQCYSRRAPAVLDWLLELARTTRRRLMVRLVKGAYWDTEIKRAQELGVVDYPVFSRKPATDLCYIACAKQALAAGPLIFPQFATHNAHTIAAILQLAGDNRDFEFQRLHGMGELVHASARALIPDMPRTRVYAPVGTHKDLLAYLVRRLLENAANSSFVNRFMDERVPVDQLIQDPIAQALSMTHHSVSALARPANLFGDRLNSKGMDLNDPQQTTSLLASLESLSKRRWEASPILSGQRGKTGANPVRNPANHGDTVGATRDAEPQECARAVSIAVAAQRAWNNTGADSRARILERVADALEAAHVELISLLVREAGKTLGDAHAEVREAVDFCRYYAVQARAHFGNATQLASPTGEQNHYSLHGRGAFVCISPWNFPLAILVGQVTAALAAGNSVLAKPAPQTPLIAAAAIELLHRAGVPPDVLHLLPGGSSVGAELVADERIAGVAFTGSTATARTINRILASRNGPIVPLVAETGGQNAMFVDSSALPEQVVDDVIRSAFHSAGQRCSALRVLYLQDEVADGVLQMLTGAMDALSVGDPAQLATDIGPVIDEQSRAALTAHATSLESKGRLLHTIPLTDACANGTFVAPSLFLIRSIAELQKEHFGPLLHVVRYRSQELERHLTELAATGYGLTLGVHSRITAMPRKIFDNAAAGNTYVNRNMIGAVVAVQPFGGHGLSGTGPKAGGPLYLQRFATERVFTVNTAATGGNIELLRAQT